MNRFDAVQACPPLASRPTTAAFGGGVDIGVGEHHERVRAAEFEHELLHVPAGDLADGGPGLLRSGHRNALDAGVGDRWRRPEQRR